MKKTYRWNKCSSGIGKKGTIGFGIKENNFLGQGLTLDSNFTLHLKLLKESSQKSNFNNDKSLYVSAEAIETDNFKTTGYKTNKTGLSIEPLYMNDLFLGVGNSNFYEKIETNSTASDRQKAQAGNYWDSFLILDFNYDKRNQKFQTSSGFRSFYSIDVPLVSDTNTLKNYYKHHYIY